jgi:hypothetical protein
MRAGASCKKQRGSQTEGVKRMRGKRVVAVKRGSNVRDNMGEEFERVERKEGQKPKIHFVCSTVAQRENLEKTLRSRLGWVEPKFKVMTSSLKGEKVGLFPEAGGIL